MTNRRGAALLYRLSPFRTGRPLVVFSNPLLEESLFCKNHISSWSKYLSEQNCNVLTFDYEGSGNSEGEYPVPADWMADDLVDLVDWCRCTYHAEPVSLIGIRFGLNVAMRAAERLEIERIVGVEPIVNLHDYWTMLLRNNLTMQLSVTGKVVESRKRLMRRLEYGERINISGYEVDRRFFRSLSSFELQRCDPAVATRSMLYFREGVKRKKREARALQSLMQQGFRCEEIEMDPFWKETQRYQPFQSVLFREAGRVVASS